MISTRPQLYKDIAGIIENLDPGSIPQDRQNILQPLVNYIRTRWENKEPIRLNFICTHNSRRSHLSQVWAQTMAYHFGVKDVQCYSAGTERTALFPVAAKTLQESGFRVAILAETGNPVYSIKFADSEHPVIGFSKTLADEFNPKSGFAAIMTCSQADAGCPFIAGAEVRIPLTYEDPKAFDNTPQQTEKYKERSLQIATEMYFVFSRIKS